MHHAESRHFEPPGSLADSAGWILAGAFHALDIQFEGGFREGEIARPVPGFQGTGEDGGHKRLQAPLHIGHGNVFFHQQPFKLVEHGGMGGIAVPAVHLPRADNPDGGSILQHRPDLHG